MVDRLNLSKYKKKKEKEKTKNKQRRRKKIFNDNLNKFFGGRKNRHGKGEKKPYDSQQNNNGEKQSIHSNDTMITNKMMTRNMFKKKKNYLCFKRLFNNGTKCPAPTI